MDIHMIEAEIIALKTYIYIHERVPKTNFGNIYQKKYPMYLKLNAWFLI